MQTLDIVVGGCVEGPPQAAPPSSPAVGAAYLVAGGATGAWSGQTDCVAAWTRSGWRFVVPTPGLQLLDRSTDTISVYRDGGWDLGIVRATSIEVGGLQVVGPRASAVPPPTGGSVIDNEARAAISAVLAALQQHGLIA